MRFNNSFILSHGITERPASVASWTAKRDRSKRSADKQKAQNRREFICAFCALMRRYRHHNAMPIIPFSISDNTTGQTIVPADCNSESEIVPALEQAFAQSGSVHDFPLTLRDGENGSDLFCGSTVTFKSVISLMNSLLVEADEFTFQRLRQYVGEIKMRAKQTSM